MNPSFWQSLPRPIIGLAPMDGVTDPAFRAVVDQIGHPSVLYTEFISADGFIRGIHRLERTLTHHQTQTPLVVQLFSANPDAVYQAVKRLGESYPDIQGVDINMGCPNKHIVAKSGGASLIKNPKLARVIIRKAKQAASELDRPFPISVKTRIGYTRPQTTAWISTLLEEKPAVIALHGRTVTQEYQGHADWEEIGKAALLTKKTNTLLLGNGDIHSYEEAKEMSLRSAPDGVLIGRAAWGNPWIFTGQPASREMKLAAILSHCAWFQALTPQENPLSLRKHISWYIKGFSNASAIRQHIMLLSTIEEMEAYISSLPLIDSSDVIP